MILTRLTFLLVLVVLSLAAYESRFEHAYPLLNELRTASGLWFSNFQHFSFGLVATFTALSFAGYMVLPVSKKEKLSAPKKKWITLVLGMLPAIGYIAWWEFDEQAARSLLAVDYLDVSFNLAGMAFALWLYRKFIMDAMLCTTDKVGFILFLVFDVPLLLLEIALFELYKRHLPISVFFQ